MSKMMTELETHTKNFKLEIPSDEVWKMMVKLAAVPAECWDESRDCLYDNVEATVRYTSSIDDKLTVKVTLEQDLLRPAQIKPRGGRK